MPTTLQDLQTLSINARLDSGCTEEVQAILIKDAVVLTANAKVSTQNLLGSWGKMINATFLGRIPANIVAHMGLTGPKDVKAAATVEKAAEKIPGGGLIVLEGGQADLHAEQGLLLTLAELMSGNDPQGDIIVGGRNPPCGSCRKVLDAFSDAYWNWGYGTLIYDVTAGQDRKVSRLNLRQQFPLPGWGRFSNFVKQYTADMSK